MKFALIQSWYLFPLMYCIFNSIPCHSTTSLFVCGGIGWLAIMMLPTIMMNARSFFSTFSTFMWRKSKAYKNTCYYINWWTDKLTRITSYASDEPLCASCFFLIFFGLKDVMFNVNGCFFALLNTRSLNLILNHLYLYPFGSRLSTDCVLGLCTTRAIAHIW